MASLSAPTCCSQLHLRPTRSNQPLSVLALNRSRIPNTKIGGLPIGPRTRTPSAGSDNINRFNSYIIINSDNVIINNNSDNNNNGGGHGHGGHGGHGGHDGHDDHDGGALDANRVWALKKAKEEPETMRRWLLESQRFTDRLLAGDLFLLKLAMACGIVAGVIAKVTNATNGLIIPRKDVVKEIEDKVEEIPVVSTPDKVENKQWSSFFQIKAKLLAAINPTESSTRDGPYQPAAMTKISAQLSGGSSGQSGKGGKA